MPVFELVCQFFIGYSEFFYLFFYITNRDGILQLDNKFYNQLLNYALSLNKEDYCDGIKKRKSET
jgi:hypothetical protein